jgi:putative transport protein
MAGARSASFVNQAEEEGVMKVPTVQNKIAHSSSWAYSHAQIEEMMHEWLEHSPIARLFAIIAVGYLVGEIRFPGGFRLGVAGVLFVGLICGAFGVSAAFPVEVQDLGLVLFVYCIGLQAAPGFFASFKREGLPLNVAAAVALLVSAAVVAVVAHVAGTRAPLFAGLFSGALTNTPALGAITEVLTAAGNVTGAQDAVLGFGVGYPVGMIAVLLLVQSLTGRGRRPTNSNASVAGPAATLLIDKTQTNGGLWTIASLQRESEVIVTRCRLPDGTDALATDMLVLVPGTLAIVVGTETQIEKASSLVGKVSARNLLREQIAFSTSRYFVSNPDAVQRPLRELSLASLGAVISRLRRGDIDLPVHASTRLQFGDRVKVVCYRDNEPSVRKFFGNSLVALSETGYFSFGLGIVLGMLLGQLPIPIPFLAEPIRLGMAGGTLIVALILGSRGRTGPFIWSIPHQVNLTLRHLGALFFLAAVGVRAGAGLPSILRENGLTLILLSLLFVAVAHGVFLLGIRLARQQDMTVRLGSIAALQTQPAILAFAQSKTAGDDLATAYASVYPLALMLKVVLVQILIRL